MELVNKKAKHDIIKDIRIRSLMLLVSIYNEQIMEGTMGSIASTTSGRRVSISLE
jgi:hydroxypyruvate isomerase